MRKMLAFLLLGLFGFTLFGCKSKDLIKDDYDSVNFGKINIKKDNVKILQLTDLHLTYGYDALDRKTFAMIEKLVAYESPDVIVITGDMFMTVLTKKLFKPFIKFMDKFNIPWTFVFGNHDSEVYPVNDLLNIIYKTKTKNLFFHHGPKLSDDNTHGASNFKLRIVNDDKELLNLYLLDSKKLRTDGINNDPDLIYDYLSEEQVKWYEDEVKNDSVESLMFVHIPLLEFLEYTGELGEKIWTQGKNTGIFDKITTYNKTKGVFVGHDHLNNFAFYKDGVLLAYGNNSGYNAYGVNDKGARVITYNYETKELATYIILDKEV